MRRKGRIPPRAAAAQSFVRTFASIRPEERRFPHHYLLYVAKGAVRLDVGGRTWVLPPQRAAWIDAGTPITVRSSRPLTTASVLFDPRRFAASNLGCRVFAMSPLARELVAYVTAEPLPRARSIDPAFELLAALAQELARSPDDFWLPRATTPALRRTIDAVLEDPANAPPVARAAADAGMSVRTFSRRLTHECATSWRDVVHRARMVRACELLAGERMKVAAIAQAVGFATQPAFVTAFGRFTGATPSAFRRRIASPTGQAIGGIE
jgi:AraC-like DNA-binding protein